MQKLDPEITLVFFFKNCLKMLVILPVWLLFVGIGQYFFHINSLFFDAVGFLLLLSFILLGYFWALLTYNSYRYEVTANGLLIEKGVLIKQSITIPYHSIQTVDYYINPIIIKLLGLYNIHIQTRELINTSGTLAHAIKETIPGLTKDAADKLKSSIVTLSHQQIPHRSFVNLTTGHIQ